MSFNIKYSLVAVDKFSKVAEKVNKSSKKINKSMDSMSKKARLVNNSMSKLKAGIVGAVTGVALVSGMKKIVSVGSEFEDSLLDLSAITGSVGKDLDELAKKSKEFGLKFGQGPSQVAKAMKLIASAKPELLKNTKLLQKMTKEVLLLQTASGMDTETAALVTARALNIFGKSAEKAGEFVNILAEGSKSGTSEIRDTGEAVLIAGGAARSAGLNFVQLNALIQATAKGGFVAQKAGTGLQAILSRLPKVGLDIKKIGLEKTFELIGNAIEKTTDQRQRAALIEKIFGLEHQKVGFALIEHRKILSDMERKLVGTNTATEQANVRMQAFSFQARVLGVRLQTKLIQAFDRLRPKLIELVNAVGKFIDSITSEQIDAFANSVKTILTLLIKMTTFLTKIAILIDKISKTKLFKIATFGGLFQQINAKDVKKEPVGLNAMPESFLRPKNEESKSRIDVNINAPEGIVQSVKSKSTGKTAFNLGQNGRLATSGGY